MKTNSLGRELPERIGGYCPRPYMAGAEAAAPRPAVTGRTVSRCTGGKQAVGQSAGCHSGRGTEGRHDHLLPPLLPGGGAGGGQVMAAIRELGIHGLRFAPSAVVNPQGFSLAEYVRDGTISRVEASGIRGELGGGLLDGSLVLPEPVILRPHGARPRAIETGELAIFLSRRMVDRGITASFALGGITAAITEMYDAGQIHAVECSQSFDAVAAKVTLTRGGDRQRGLFQRIRKGQFPGPSQFWRAGCVGSGRGFQREHPHRDVRTYDGRSGWRP